MANRYEIWDKKSPIITPVGEYFTAEEWVARKPVAQHITCVCQAGEIKGGFFDSLAQMKAVFGQEGCDFSACTTDEEILEAIEAFEDARNAEAANYVSTEERIAAALEAQTMMAMEDVATEEETV